MELNICFYHDDRGQDDVWEKEREFIEYYRNVDNDDDNDINPEE